MNHNCLWLICLTKHVRHDKNLKYKHENDTHIRVPVNIIVMETVVYQQLYTTIMYISFTVDMHLKRILWVDFTWNYKAKIL